MTTRDLLAQADKLSGHLAQLPSGELPDCPALASMRSLLEAGERLAMDIMCRSRENRLTYERSDA